MARASRAARNWPHWRADIDALYRGAAPPQLSGLAQAVRTFDLQRDDFIAVIDGMEMDVIADIRAPDRTTLDLYCDRVACAVGRLSVRVFGMEHDAGIALAHHLGRALQLTNILRDLDEDASLGRLYLPREALHAVGIQVTEPIAVLANPAVAGACASIVALAKTEFAAAKAIMKKSPRRVVRAPRIMGEAYWLILAVVDCSRLRAAARARFDCHAQNSCSSCCVISCDRMSGTVHIIGAGLAGLSAAVRLTARGKTVAVHEATAFAGGRCRSYHDASVGMTIDNGNHLLLSGNRAALDYLHSIGADNRLIGPEQAEFSFVDLLSGERWTLRFNDGPVPFWIFDRASPRAGDEPARLSAAGAAALAARRQDGRRSHHLQGNALRAIGRAADPCGVEHRCASWSRAARERDRPRNACRWRPGLPSADRARGIGYDPDRAGAGFVAAARDCGAV